MSKRKRVTTPIPIQPKKPALAVQQIFPSVKQHRALTTRRTMAMDNHITTLQWVIDSDPDDLEAISTKDDYNKIITQIT